MCLDRKASRTIFPVQTRSEHHPVSYQSSLHSAVSDSKAVRSPLDQSHPDTASPSHRPKTRTPISISETPSTQTFDNTLVDFPVTTPSSQLHRLQDSVTSSLSSTNQRRQNETRERHLLPDPVTSSSSANQLRRWRRNEMLNYFAVRRPQVKWKRPVRLPPTNSERCLKTFIVYQSRSQMSHLASSTHTVSNTYRTFST